MKQEPQKILLHPNDVLFTEGAPSNGIYLIQEGSVEIYRTHEAHDVTLTNLNPGDVIGTITMISKGPRMASARAKTRCVLTFYPNDNLKENLKLIPVWAQAVIKDAIARIKEVDDKLLESTLREKSLQKIVGNIFQHSAQLSYLLAAFIRKGSVIDDMNITLYPLKDFIIQAEFILNKKYTYLEKIFDALKEHNLFMVSTNQKYGYVISKAHPELIEDYGNFAVILSKSGSTTFIPTKYHKYMLAVVQVSKKYNNLEKFEKSQFIELYKQELGKDEVHSIIEQLVQYEVIVENSSTYHVSPSKIKKTIIFEGIARALKEIIA